MSAMNGHSFVHGANTARIKPSDAQGHYSFLHHFISERSVRLENSPTGDRRQGSDSPRKSIGETVVDRCNLARKIESATALLRGISRHMAAV